MGLAQAVSNTLYAAAKLRLTDGRLVTGLTLAADRLAPHMDAQHLSNSLWALAELDVGLPDTVFALLRHLSDSQPNAVDISSALWALARLQCLPQADLQVRPPAWTLPHLGPGSGSAVCGLRGWERPLSCEPAAAAAVQVRRGRMRLHAMGVPGAVGAERIDGSCATRQCVGGWRCE